MSMKLWQAILLTIAIIAGLLFLPAGIAKPITSLIVLLSAIWVYKDAQKFDTKKYKSNLGMSPSALALCTFILWIIFFPGYLWLRYRIKNNLVPIREKYKARS